jgi:poly(ADP-ribose) glycohydrolase ARH3
MTTPDLASRFQGCLLGGLLGDMIGAVVEAESAGYIRKTFRGIDDILALDVVDEGFGRTWAVGQATDDTLMTIDVAEWLLEDDGVHRRDGRALLARFAATYRPDRRYGSSVARLLEQFHKTPDKWRSLATMQFPDGSYGNGAAMRSAPIGLACRSHLALLVDVVRASALPTHKNPLAIEGAVLVAAAVALACRSDGVPNGERALPLLRAVLGRLRESWQPETPFGPKLDLLAACLQSNPSPVEAAGILGSGVEALESVPLALYLAFTSTDIADVVTRATFAGGDTDTVASMAASIVGAALGRESIPASWISRVRDDVASVSRMNALSAALAIRFT